MTNEFTKFYELLGVSPGVSRQELKAAYRDLAKVWHPDRFAHDPRLQAKAQNKLKEINEAYDQLVSGKMKRQPPTYATAASSYSGDFHVRNGKGSYARGAAPIRWQLVLCALLIFGVTFFFSSRSFIRLQRRGPIVEQIPAVEVNAGEQSGSRGSVDADELSRGKNRIAEERGRQESDGGGPVQENVAVPTERVATATVTIDPTTGMLARPDCPVKTRMTYPSGNEPNQYCNLHLSLKPAPGPVERPKDSRIKSVAKRIASPDKWLEGN
jgi:hypothetical protein